MRELTPLKLRVRVTLTLKNTHLQQSIYNIIRAELLSRCVEIQKILNGNFSQWTEDMLQRAFDDLLDSKKFVKSVGTSILNDVVITGVQELLGNPVDVGDLKDEVELIGDVAKEIHVGNPTGLNE